MEEVLRDRAEQPENQETTPEEVREENEEVEVEARETRVFFSDKGDQAFRKSLAKKGFVEERGFKEMVSHFKEKV